jgi:hypothetical protein
MPPPHGKILKKGSDCSVFATCADTGPGTYNCTCNKGYTGNGKICKGLYNYLTEIYVRKMCNVRVVFITSVFIWIEPHKIKLIYFNPN